MHVEQKLKVGLLADIHYDGSAVAMNRLYEAVGALNAGGVDSMVVMGDLINGKNEMHAKRMLREVSALCDSFKGTTYFMHGNHDLDHISKEEFYSAIGRAGDPSRFHFEQGGYEFICIDANFSPDESAYDKGNFDWKKSWVPEEQLDWLRGRLAASMLPVVLISHQRIDQESIHAVGNFEAVLDMVNLSGKVNTVIQGHNHEDDLKQIKDASYYTLSAHTDGAGPAVIVLEASGIRLLRDFHSTELV